MLVAMKTARSGQNWKCDGMPGTSQARQGRPERAGGSVTAMLSPGQDRQDGLRERKKARTRASIREHALRLFREQGYHKTTVEQIAAAAEVSPSTFFRYFPTKEDVVLQDAMDTRLAEALVRQPAEIGPVAAMRAAAAQTFQALSTEDQERMRETATLTMSVPELRARAVDEFT